MSKREEFLEELRDLLKKYDASIIVKSSEWTDIKINVSGNLGAERLRFDMGDHKLNSKTLGHFVKEGD